MAGSAAGAISVTVPAGSGEGAASIQTVIFIPFRTEPMADSSTLAQQLQWHGAIDLQKRQAGGYQRARVGPARDDNVVERRGDAGVSEHARTHRRSDRLSRFQIVFDFFKLSN